MLSPKYLPKNKPSLQNPLKLPEIPSRNKLQSIKKSAPIIPDLPQIKNKALKNHPSVNKQNHSLNPLQRRNSLNDQIKARLLEIEAAQKVVKNVLGRPQDTLQVGGDMTNFQLKIEANRQILRKNRNKTHFTEQNPQIFQQQKQVQNLKQLKLKSVSSKEIISDMINPHQNRQDLKLKIQQNADAHAKAKKHDEKSQNEDKDKIRFISQRKPKYSSKPKNEEESRVFKSIKQILQDPRRKALDLQAKKVKKMVKFTIDELENRLKKMKSIEFNQSTCEDSQKNQQKRRFDRKMTSAKSVGMIPIIDSPICKDYTFKNWNRVEFSQGQQGSEQKLINSNKLIKYHKSDFENEVNQIQKLEMKSYKSIEKMVQNRKMLIDLQLFSGKNKSCGVVQKQTEKNKQDIDV